MPHVLVVDDDTAIRQMLRLVLEDEGYAVREAMDGIEALAALRVSARPLVVLLDLMMPRLGGDGVLAAVTAKSNLATRHAYILMTASAGWPEACGAMLARLDAAMVLKPFDLDELVGLVAQAARRLARGLALATAAS